MRNKFLVVLLSTAVSISTLFSTEAMAAAKNYLYTSKKPVTKKTIYVGGSNVKLKYNIGGKTTGIKGTWKSQIRQENLCPQVQIYSRDKGRGSKPSQFCRNN